MKSNSPPQNTGSQDLPREPLQPPGFAEMLGFALPLMMGLTTVAVHSIIDSIFVGRLGTAPLAALGMANLYYFTGVALWLGLMRNSITFTARAFGARESGRIGNIVAHYQWLALLGIPMLWAAARAFPLMGRLAGLTEEVGGLAQSYLDIRVWEAGFMLTLLLYSAFYQSTGNSRLPMLVNWGALALNVLLDYMLIFGRLGAPNMGIQGAALATVLAQAAGAAAMLAMAYRHKIRVRYGLRLLVRPRWWMLRNIIVVGVPQGLGDLMELGGFLAFYAIVGRLGEVALAASNIGVQVTHLLFMPGLAVGIAAGAYMGRYLGAGAPGVAHTAARRMLLMGMTYMGLMGLPLWFLGAPIAMLFTTDVQVISQAALLFKLMALYQAFDGMGMIMRGALNGAGDTRFPVLATLLCKLGVMFPVAWWLSTSMEQRLLGAWLGASAYLVVLGLTLLLRFERGGWRNIRLDLGQAAGTEEA
ncbi:MAG: MATE family efflux transporter [SAR324 cluster bacterium]|nr:MATE family efflux transporter [SAR324 cluster bacterium]